MELLEVENLYKEFYKDKVKFAADNRERSLPNLLQGVYEKIFK